MILKGYSNLINFMVMPEKCNAKGVKLLKIKTGIRVAWWRMYLYGIGMSLITKGIKVALQSLLYTF